MPEKILFCWSSGKDSALALHTLLNDHQYEVTTLLTTLTQGYDRISMHGIRRVLLEQQAESIGIPLEKVFIPQQCTDEMYRNKMQAVLEKFKVQGINSVAFGDLFLEGVRQYRLDNLAKLDMKAVFPLWQMDTRKLAEDFIDLGFKSVITCVDTQMLDGKFAGRYFDRRLLEDLPEGVDPCGENGEFHSFACGGPIFTHPIKHRLGEVVLRDNRFCFCDVLPE